MAFDYRDGYSNCPPGYYRPAPMYDCRPNVSGAVIQQQNLERAAARYVDDGSTGSTATNTQSTVVPPYQMPVIGAQVPTASGGINSTMLLVIGVLVIFLMKR